MTVHTATCVYCRAAIPSGASVCEKCKHYQHPWRNWVPHVGTAITLLTVALAALTYVGTSLKGTYLNRFGTTGIECLSFSSVAASTFVNNGNHDVIVEMLHFRALDFANDAYVSINKTIKVGDLLVFEPNTNELSKHFQLIASEPTPFNGGPHTVHGLSSEETESIVDELKRGRYLTDLYLDIAFYDDNNPELKVFQAQTFAGKVATFKASVNITYTRISTGKRFQMSRDCVAVLFALSDPAGKYPFDEKHNSVILKNKGDARRDNPARRTP